ncbi:MAG: hypothetical protein DA405_11190 [Bacteroidetes bacterium]|nr:MAG: hypothetical protein DA405_11190 [Bacteroidota bacterium]
MANTVKISKAKNLIFKKLNFLYLVFILFLFLSSPGRYVVHYTDVVRTQSFLNNDLEDKLTKIELKDDRLIEIAKLVQGTINELNYQEASFVESIGGLGLSGEKLKESIYSNKEIVKGAAGEGFMKTIANFHTQFYQLSGVDLSEELLFFKDFSGEELPTIEYFFKDTPNGVISSIFEHFKSVILLNGISALKVEKIVLENLEVLELEHLDLFQKFAKRVKLGDYFILNIKNEGIPLSVWLDGKRQMPSSEDSSRSVYQFKPDRLGKHNVDVLFNDKRYVHSFTVFKPNIELESSNGFFVGQVGENLEISFDPNIILSDKFSFASKYAEVEKVGEKIIVTPTHIGAFSVYLMENDLKLDSIYVYAKDVSYIEIALLDIAGDSTDLSNAFKLEAKNPFWQVSSYSFELVSPKGERVVFNNTTRLINPKIKEVIEKAPKGSLMKFFRVEVVGKNGKNNRKGEPLLIRK